MSIFGNGKMIGNGVKIINIAPFALNTDTSLMMYYTFEPSTYNATSKTFQNLGQSQYGVATVGGSNITVDTTNYVVGTSSITSTGVISGNYVTLPNFTVTSGNITFAFWIRRNGTGIPNEWPYLFSCGGFQGVQNGGSNKYLYANFGITIDSNVQTNAWNHIAFVYSNTATNKTIIYENGTAVYTSTTNKLSTGNATGHCLLGFYGGSAFNGNFDEFRIYGRDLSQSEIVQLYNYRG